MNFLVVLFAKPNNIKWPTVVGMMGLGVVSAHPAWLPKDGLVFERIVQNYMSRPTHAVLLHPLVGSPLVCGLPFRC